MAWTQVTRMCASHGVAMLCGLLQLSQSVGLRSQVQFQLLTIPNHWAIQHEIFISDFSSILPLKSVITCNFKISDMSLKNQHGLSAQMHS